ncbi:hypothetical protein LTR33_005017, partial [Friedmanniomyces endolithicus]
MATLSLALPLAPREDIELPAASPSDGLFMPPDLPMNVAPGSFPALAFFRAPFVRRDDTDTTVPITVVSTERLPAGNKECKVWRVTESAGVFSPSCRTWSSDPDGSTTDDQMLELWSVKLTGPGTVCAVWHVEAHHGLSLLALIEITTSPNLAARALLAVAEKRTCRCAPLITRAQRDDRIRRAHLRPSQAEAVLPVVTAPFKAPESWISGPLHFGHGPAVPSSGLIPREVQDTDNILMNPSQFLSVYILPKLCKNDPCSPHCLHKTPGVICPSKAGGPGQLEGTEELSPREDKRETVYDPAANVGPVGLPSVAPVDQLVDGIKDGGEKLVAEGKEGGKKLVADGEKLGGKLVADAEEVGKEFVAVEKEVVQEAKEMI